VLALERHALDAKSFRVLAHIEHAPNKKKSFDVLVHVSHALYK